MKLNKYIALGGLALGLSMSSCIGDLDLEPNDPNYGNATDYAAVLAKCYSGMAVSGQDGPGSSDISGLDNGRGQYCRAIFMMNEFPTDECLWIWKDEGIYDICTNSFDASNGNIYGTYSRLYSHIAVCNDFIANARTNSDPVVQDMVLQARTLRAMSYYWVVDIFGQGSFITEEAAVGENPVQKSRLDLYNWLKDELEDIVAKFKDSDMPVAYGHVGLDGAQALLARLYLNAKVYTDGKQEGWAECQKHCEEIIARHKGGGFNGSGLANHYLYLFCRDNHVYMPGGGNTAENEILWGLAFEPYYTQSYGAANFIICASITTANMDNNGFSMSSANYGMVNEWTCMHGRKEFFDKFTDGDKRSSLWLKEDDGFTRENTDYSTFNNGYATVKFTNLIAGADGGWSQENGGIYGPVDSEGKPTMAANTQNWPDTDYPLIRLADVYLMYTECFIMGNVGDQAKALRYASYVSERAGQRAWVEGDLTADNILDERARELYWELTRRSDLVRHDKYTGGRYLWSWKGNVAEGNSINERYKLMPIPVQIISAQPEFKQNPGY